MLPNIVDPIDYIWWNDKAYSDSCIGSARINYHIDRGVRNTEIPVQYHGLVAAVSYEGQGG